MAGDNNRVEEAIRVLGNSAAGWDGRRVVEEVDKLTERESTTVLAVVGQGYDRELFRQVACSVIERKLTEKTLAHMSALESSGTWLARVGIGVMVVGVLVAIAQLVTSACR